MVPDYVCNGCSVPCGGDVGGPAFVVDREPGGDSDMCFAVVCAVCWNKMVRACLDDDWLEPTDTAPHGRAGSGG